MSLRPRPRPRYSLPRQAFLFYWLFAPNIAAFRRNRALRGRIAAYPGAEGNYVAIFSARVVSATEEVKKQLLRVLARASCALLSWFPYTMRGAR